MRKKLLSEIPTLTGERLVLKRLGPADAEPLRELVNPQKKPTFTLADALGDALKDLHLE